MSGRGSGESGACIIELQRTEERHVHILLLPRKRTMMGEGRPFLRPPFANRPRLCAEMKIGAFFCPALSGFLMVRLHVRFGLWFNN